MTSGTTTINKNAVGVGTTTTAGRNAGVGTATGTIIYNTNFNALQVYTGSQWNVINTKTPNFAINYLCLLYTSPSPRDRTRSRMPSSA